jgi:homoserine dehydrogenase
MAMRTVRLAIVGLGNVGRRLLELMDLKRDWLRDHYDLELVVAGAVDRSGAAMAPDGLAIKELLHLKRGKKGMAGYAQAGRAGMTPLDLVRQAGADVLVELSLTNLKDGEPGLSAIREALHQKMSVVTANKGPLVLAYQELAALARRNEGVVNGTTNYILTRMSEGQGYDEALKHAQDIGMAEADPTLDVDGWDAANKLVIIANAVLRRPTMLKDVTVQGIRGVTKKDLDQATEHRQVIKLIALAEKIGDDYELSVRPTRLERSHPLSKVGAGMMGIMYHTDINGTIFSAIEEHDPYPTAAGVLRDIVNVYN